MESILDLGFWFSLILLLLPFSPQGLEHGAKKLDLRWAIGLLWLILWVGWFFIGRF
jgi:hypothetical protein